MILIRNWFIGKELSFALNLSLAISRFGIVLSRYLSPFFYERMNSLTLTFWIDDIYVLFSFACGFFAILLDQYAKGEKEKEDVTSRLRALRWKYLLIAVLVLLWHASFDSFMHISTEYIAVRFSIQGDLIKGLNVNFPLTIGIDVFDNVSRRYGNGLHNRQARL